MVKIQSLRPDNFVGFKNRIDIKYCIVESVSKLGGIHIIRHFEDGTIDDQPEFIEDITGIPIDINWLTNLGFEQLGDNFRINNIIFSSLCQNGIYTLYPRIGYNRIFFIHHLQNVIMDLTDLELEMWKPDGEV